MIEDVKPDLIFITETWLHADIKKRRSKASANRSERSEQNAEGRLHIMYAKRDWCYAKRTS